MEVISKKCPYCKEEIQSDAIKCKHCGEYVRPNAEQQQCPPQPHNNQGKPLPPNNYLVWAILVTIFCCVPFGIVSIVYAAKVDTAYAQGQIEESYKLSRQTRNWINASWITGLSVILLYILFWVVLGVGAASSAFWW